MLKKLTGKSLALYSCVSMVGGTASKNKLFIKNSNFVF